MSKEDKDYRLKLMTAVVREAPKQGGITEKLADQINDYLRELVQARKALRGIDALCLQSIRVANWGQAMRDLIAEHGKLVKEED